MKPTEDAEYRLLKDEEIILASDEYWHYGSGPWKIVHGNTNDAGEKWNDLTYVPFRRKIKLSSMHVSEDGQFEMISEVIKV